MTDHFWNRIKRRKHIGELLKEREPYYREAADLEVVTDQKSADEIAIEIKKLLDSSKAV